MKKILLGCVIGILISFSTTVFASGVVMRKISVAFDSINVHVNGKKVNAPNILYNGRTYVQLRTISEILNKNVTWDNKNRIANIKDKQVTEPISFSNITIKTEYGYTKAYGNIKNNSSKKYSISLKSVYYNSAGKIIGTGMDFITDLQPGQTKTFETISLSDCSKYKTHKLEIENLFE